MSLSVSGGSSDVYYDPYMREIVYEPYPVYARLREEAPLYYNEKYDFYAVSRYEDVRRSLRDHETFISGRGGILELIKENVQMPPGTFIFEDPPLHTAHRTVVQRVFAPKRLLGLEDKVRAITARCLDKLEGREEFDFIGDIGAQIPMIVIGTLLGLPEEEFENIRQSADDRIITAEGEPIDYGGEFNMDASMFEPYVAWRENNPDDDVITELLGVEFEDETGTKRKLTREELLTFVNVLAGAGNETTNKLIGWTGKLLGEHPDQRRALVADPSLIPQAIEEILRFEPPGPHLARYVTQDTEFHGQTVPAGSVLVLIAASANRDKRVFDNPETFDIHRPRKVHCSFGYGIHNCIGQVLARMEGTVVLEELLKRFPDWEVDRENAELLCTSTVRGWDRLPAYVSDKGASIIRDRVAQMAEAEKAVTGNAPADIDGEWNVVINGPTGPMENLLVVETNDGVMQGRQGEAGGEFDIVDDVGYEDGDVHWINKIKKPMKMKLHFSGKVEGDTMTGKVKAGFMGTFPFTATKK